MSHSFTIGIHIDGAGSHPASWHDYPDDIDRLTGAARTRELIARLESSGLTYATFAGSHLPPASSGAPGRLAPVQQAAFAGPLTTRLGLIPEIPVTYVEPFHTATQLASLDHASNGRAGWLVSAENSTEAARQFGLEALDAAELAAEIEDVVRVNRLLWASWDEDAVIRDRATGRYLDRDKLHYADFHGRGFSVKGPAITPRPPQGQLPVFARLEHSGADADIVLVDGGASLARDVDAAREAGARRVVADLEVVLDARGETASARLARLDAHDTWARTAVERYAGDADGLVDRIRELSRVVDGVRLIPASLEQDLDELRFQILPALLTEGVIAGGAPAHLRGALGLPVTATIPAPEGATV